jgi:hypothetical protein
MICYAQSGSRKFDTRCYDLSEKKTRYYRFLTTIIMYDSFCTVLVPEIYFTNLSNCSQIISAKSIPSIAGNVPSEGALLRSFLMIIRC